MEKKKNCSCLFNCRWDSGKAKWVYDLACTIGCPIHDKNKKIRKSRKLLILLAVILLSNEAYSQKKADSLTHLSIGWVKQNKDFFQKVNDSTVVSQVGNVYVLRGKRYWWKGNCK
jgi:hypothetical protein